MYPVAFLLSVVAAILSAHCTARLLAYFGFPITAGANRFAEVDGLRGYLAILVMIHHFSIWYVVSEGAEWRNPSNNFLAQMGAGSVSFFFMVTGLVFYSKVLAGIRKVDWASLLIGRIMRIMPLVVLAVAIVASIAKLRGGGAWTFHEFARLGIWLSAYEEPDLFGLVETGRINAHVLWSLWWEWIFYLVLLPLSAALREFGFKERATYVLPFALLVLAVASRFFIARLVLGGFFAIGMLAYEIRERPFFQEWLKRDLSAIVAIALMALAVVFKPNPYGIMMPAFAFFFFCVASGNSFFGILSQKSARVLGECSFGIYLLHGIVLYMVFTNSAGDVVKLPYRDWVIVPVASAIVLVTAAIFLLIERPCIRLGKAWARNRCVPPSD